MLRRPELPEKSSAFFLSTSLLNPPSLFDVRESGIHGNGFESWRELVGAS